MISLGVNMELQHRNFRREPEKEFEYIQLKVRADDAIILCVYSSEFKPYLLNDSVFPS